MKLVFFGTPQFAVPSLEILSKCPEIEITAVVTQSDKPVGRKKIIIPSPVKQKAVQLGLKILQPKNKKELIDSMKNIEADIFLTIAYGMILPKEVLKMPKISAINVHPSLLPRFRGASPIQETLLNGDKETGISIIQMTEAVDEGPIYFVKRVQIDPNDNLQSLTKKLAEISSQILPLVLEDIEKKILQPLPQNNKKAVYCRKINKTDGKIDWNKSAEEISNMIKAFTPWPSVYTEFKGKNFKILEAEIENSTTKKAPGTFFLEGKILKIAAKKGVIIPKKVQLEGKKEMDAQTFVNGYKNLLFSEK